MMCIGRSYPIIMEQVHIGHYILGKTIGTGGFAKVKEARHDLTGERVAVKILNKRKMKNKNMISKVKREIKILKFINHHNIIKLYEVLDTTNDIFVIMELAEGGELYDYIQNHALSEADAKFFFKQIVSGVAYAHQNLIAHRDLKPENILIHAGRLIKIVDFGLSNLMKDGKLLKTACGSPNYAAPEVVGERKYQGTSVDIWSCGVILFALLSGRLPFDEETVTLLYKKIEQGNYVIPKTVNPLAADLIQRMLQVDPYKRIKIYEIATHPWMRPTLPLYSKIYTSFSSGRDDEFQLDDQIFQQVKKINWQELNQSNEDKYKKSIRKRDDESFVITYELLRDRKQKKHAAEETLRKHREEEHKSTILAEVDNVLKTVQEPPQLQFLYGRRFKKSIRSLAEIVIQSLRTLGIDYGIKSPEFSFKCVYLPIALHTLKGRKAHSQTETYDMLQQRTDTSERSQKYSKKQIKFGLQIYSVDKKGYEHMIDLQLGQGHPLVFFSVANKLYSLIDSHTDH